MKFMLDGQMPLISSLKAYGLRRMIIGALIAIVALIVGAVGAWLGLREVSEGYRDYQIGKLGEYKLGSIPIQNSQVCLYVCTDDRVSCAKVCEGEVIPPFMVGRTCETLLACEDANHCVRMSESQDPYIQAICRE